MFNYQNQLEPQSFKITRKLFAAGLYSYTDLHQDIIMMTVTVQYLFVFIYLYKSTVRFKVNISVNTNIANRMYEA